MNDASNDWCAKLKRLQDRHSLNSDGLASALGITTRTLSDFMRAEGAREPTGPLKKLIDLLLDDQGVAKEAKLNLVLIHGDFTTNLGDEGDPVSAIMNVHASAGSQRNNEYHYITVDPGHVKKWASAGFKMNRVSPHFMSFAENELSNQEARDCYFATTATWLTNGAMGRDLAHVTLAADVLKFWPLARAIKELAEVDVTFMLGTGANLSRMLIENLREYGVSVFNPSGRKFGYINSLTHSITGNTFSYGFIKQVEAGSPLVFFSYNHMLKHDDGRDINSINELRYGDYVSFSMGVNNKGICATDVSLVPRDITGMPINDILTNGKGSDEKLHEDNDTVSIVTNAIKVCADERGWALLAEVGSRISINHPDLKGIIKNKYSTGIAGTWKAFITAKHDNFEYSDNPEITGHGAACVRNI